MLAVVLISVIRCWVYRRVPSPLSYLWCVVISPQPYWCLVYFGCCNVEKYQVFLWGMRKAPISHSPIGVSWWGWKEIWGTCCDCRRWRLSIIWRGILLMNLLLIGMHWFCNWIGESIICRLPSTWSYWWRWQILLLIWLLLFLCTWYIPLPHTCVYFLILFSLEG